MEKEEIKPMDALTKEQKDYMGFVLSKEEMWDTYKRLVKEDKIPRCMPQSKDYYGHNPLTVIEAHYYLFLEMLEGKHNGFLQRIINDNKLKAKGQPLEMD